MTHPATIRDGFDQMIAAARAAANPDAVARLELAREYFTNPAFKRTLEKATWGATSGVGGLE